MTDRPAPVSEETEEAIRKRDNICAYICDDNGGQTEPCYTCRLKANTWCEWCMISWLLAALVSERQRAEQARVFPIAQADRRYQGAPYPRLIPWSLAQLAYGVYSQHHGSEQSIEKIAQRGGFHPADMDEFLPDWRQRCDEIKMLTARAEQAERERDDFCAEVTVKSLKEVNDIRAERDTLAAEVERLRAQTTWLPIATADADTPVTLFTPRERLTDLPVHVAPEIKDDIRVSAPRYWTWATHWQPLPPAPVDREDGSKP